MDSLILETGTYLLYDDDCGVCTKASRIFAILLNHKLRIIPMHRPWIEDEGMKRIPQDYWKSFHIIREGQWYTDGDAILQLAGLFPMGKVTMAIASIPPIFYVLTSFLKSMQRRRKVECSMDI